MRKKNANREEEENRHRKREREARTGWHERKDKLENRNVEKKAETI